LLQKKSGIEINEVFQKPLLAYLLDTHPVVFEKTPRVFDYPVIITECTFIEGEQERAERDGHTIWTALEKTVLSHPKNTFVLTHFSLRYKVQEIYSFFENLTTREDNPLDLSNVVLFATKYNED